MKKTFLIISIIEGLSLLALMGIAMPLKYIYGDPSLVRIVGMIHGVLFLIFVMVLAGLASEGIFSKKQIALILLYASLPFGFFAIDRILKRMPAPQS